MAKFAWGYGMFQYIRSVRVAYVVRISSVTSLYIGYWKVFENLSLADRQTDRQTDRFEFTKTETQFYKLRTTTTAASAVPTSITADLLLLLRPVVGGWA